jgi:hypothetical protein
MSQQQSTMASLPLIYGYSAVFEAIDATTGATVTGVTIIDPSVYGIDLSGTPDADQLSGPFMLVPGPNT